MSLAGIKLKKIAPLAELQGPPELLRHLAQELFNSLQNDQPVTLCGLLLLFRFQSTNKLEMVTRGSNHFVDVFLKLICEKLQFPMENPKDFIALVKGVKTEKPPVLTWQEFTSEDEKKISLREFIKGGQEEKGKKSKKPERKLEKTQSSRELVTNFFIKPPVNIIILLLPLFSEFHKSNPDPKYVKFSEFFASFISNLVVEIEDISDLFRAVCREHFSLKPVLNILKERSKDYSLPLTNKKISSSLKKFLTTHKKFIKEMMLVKEKADEAKFQSPYLKAQADKVLDPYYEASLEECITKLSELSLKVIGEMDALEEKKVAILMSPKPSPSSTQSTSSQRSVFLGPDEDETMEKPRAYTPFKERKVEAESNFVTQWKFALNKELQSLKERDFSPVKINTHIALEAILELLSKNLSYTPDNKDKIFVDQVTEAINHGKILDINITSLIKRLINGKLPSDRHSLSYIIG